MGFVVVGDIRVVSFWLCDMIKMWMFDYGVEMICNFFGLEFCECKFVMGFVFEDGFGNNMYKVLSGVGFVFMFNCLFIIGMLII